MEALAILLMILTAVGILLAPIITLFLVLGLRRRIDEFGRRQDRANANIVGLRSAVEGLAGTPEAATDAESAAAPAAATTPAPAETAAARPQPIEEHVLVKAEPPAAIETAAPPPLPSEPQVPAPKPSRPAAAPQPPREPSRIGKAVGDILREGWNWLLVNDKYRPEGVTAEYAIATTWMMRVGIIVVVLAIVFGLKLSIEKGLLGEEARTGMAMLAGIGMVLAGTRLSRSKTYNLLGQGFMGGGIVVLYFAAFAACVWYDIVPLTVAYGLMILVTVAAGFLAVRSDSMLVGIFGIVGGYLTPILLSTGSGNLGALYSYLLILSVGVLGVAIYRRWRIMNFLALLFTYGLVIVSLGEYYEDDRFVLCISLISALFVVHSLVIVIQSLVRKQQSTVLEIMHLVINSLAYGIIAYRLIQETLGRPYPAILTVMLAAFYVAHVVLFLRRKLIDRPLLTALLALAGLYTVLTLPIVFEKETLTLSFALMAFMFLWLGRRMNSHFLANLAHGLYLFVFYRLVAMDPWGHYRYNPRITMPMSEYWGMMVNRLWQFGGSIASVIGAFVLHRSWKRPPAAVEIGESNDTPSLVPASVATKVLYWSGILFLFAFLCLELNTMFAYFDPMRLPVLTMLCCAMGGYFLWRCFVGEAMDRGMLVGLCVFVCLAILKILTLDMVEWDIKEGLYYEMDYSGLFVGMRLLDFGALLTLLFVTWAFFLRGGDEQRLLAPAFGYGGLLLLFVYASLEVNTLLYWKLREFQNGGLSVLWALFAIAYIAGGIWRDVRPLRFVGLILFAVILGKVFLNDLRGMEIAYRVIAFMVVGVALLLGSFAYMRANKKFTQQE
jgi:uncharacterized membrane protein